MHQDTRLSKGVNVMDSQLSLLDVSKKYGGVSAAQSITLNIKKGDLLGLIGPNGSGKTTLINLISGTQKATSGKIMFSDIDITNLATYKRASLGIARTFQIVKPLMSMTVTDNVLIGSAFGNNSTKISDAIKMSMSLKKIKHCQEDVGLILNKVGLESRAQVTADQLTLPERKRLELARALAMKPLLLLLDEVMAGLNASEIEDVMELVKSINRDGITVICVEHVMKAIMNISKRVVVLKEGSIIADGLPQEIVSNDKVIKAYLGSKYAQKECE